MSVVRETISTLLFLDEDGEVIDWYSVDIDSGNRYKQRGYGVFEVEWL